MKFREYVRDKAAVIGISIFAWGILCLFFRAFHLKREQLIIYSFLYFFFEIIKLLWEYFRKRNFYTKLQTDLEKLDKKYLLTEIVTEPSFQEGKIIYETLRDSHKSMCEQVASYRHAFSEFREYIELWVHEIKLPVAGLSLMCHNHPDTFGKYTGQLQRIDEYIENVLYYARCENAEKDYLIKEISLKRVLADAALKHRDALQQHGVGLRTENLDKTVWTDGKWLEYMLGQLMGNTMKYLSEEREPEIFVHAEETKEQVILHFRDNGIGIPASDLPYIFEKSFTGANGRMHTKSTGFGLYIVKNLCTRLGHKVTASSVQGQYTEISIVFGKNEYLGTVRSNSSR